LQQVGNGVNSDGACVRRNGGQPSRRERAAADAYRARGRTGRARSRTNIQNNSFIIPFICSYLCLCLCCDCVCVLCLCLCLCLCLTLYVCLCLCLCLCLVRARARSARSARSRPLGWAPLRRAHAPSESGVCSRVKV
jgi:hypothetical protein